MELGGAHNPIEGIIERFKAAQEFIKTKTPPFNWDHIGNIQNICRFFYLYSQDLNFRNNPQLSLQNKSQGNRYDNISNAPNHRIVGDIHGDLNAFLYPLITPDEKGNAPALFNDPPYVIYDTKTRTTVEDFENVGNEEIWFRYRLVPNLRPNPAYDGRITFLGDIFDRGAYSFECFVALRLLCLEEKKMLELGGGDYVKNKKINCVFADHELYALGDSRINFRPNYYFRSDTALLSRNGNLDKDTQIYDEIKLVQAEIVAAIRDRAITYASLNDQDKILCIHSFLTQQFFQKFLGEISSIDDSKQDIEDLTAIEASNRISKAGKPTQDLQNVRDALNYFLNPNPSLQSDESYFTNLEKIINHFNEVLVFAAENSELYKKTKQMQRDGIDTLNSLFVFDEFSPISARTGTALPIVQAIGHTAQDSSRNIRKITAGQFGRNYINFDKLYTDVPGVKSHETKSYIFDQALSYKYSKSSRSASHPAISEVKPYGTIVNKCFKKEEQLFVDGAINPEMVAIVDQKYEEISKRTSAAIGSSSSVVRTSPPGSSAGSSAIETGRSPIFRGTTSASSSGVASANTSSKTNAASSGTGNVSGSGSGGGSGGDEGNRGGGGSAPGGSGGGDPGRGSGSSSGVVSDLKPDPTPNNRVVRWREQANWGGPGDNPGWYTVENLKVNKKVIFLFGDNDAAKYRDSGDGGGAGQAAVTRASNGTEFDRRDGFPGASRAENFAHGNAYGITTTFSQKVSFEEFKTLMDIEFSHLEEFVRSGGQVVIPCQSDGSHNLGTNLGTIKDDREKLGYIKKKVDDLERLGREASILKLDNPEDFLYGRLMGDIQIYRNKSSSIYEFLKEASSELVDIMKTDKGLSNINIVQEARFRGLVNCYNLWQPDADEVRQLDADKVRFFWSPLHYATLQVNLVNVKTLLAWGADVDAKDCKEKTPLQRFLAMRCKDKSNLDVKKQIILALVNAGASLQKLEIDELEILKGLCEQEALENAAQKYFYYKIGNQRLLAEEINIRSNFQVIVVKENKFVKYHSFVEAYTPHAPQDQVQDLYPIHNMVIEGDVELVRNTLPNIPVQSINRQDKHGLTPLALAFSLQGPPSLEIIRVLIENGAQFGEIKKEKIEGLKEQLFNFFIQKGQGFSKKGDLTYFNIGGIEFKAENNSIYLQKGSKWQQLLDIDENSKTEDNTDLLVRAFIIQSLYDICSDPKRTHEELKQFILKIADTRGYEFIKNILNTKLRDKENNKFLRIDYLKSLCGGQLEKITILNQTQEFILDISDSAEVTPTGLDIEEDDKEDGRDFPIEAFRSDKMDVNQFSKMIVQLAEEDLTELVNSFYYHRPKKKLEFLQQIVEAKETAEQAGIMETTILLTIRNDIISDLKKRFLRDKEFSGKYAKWGSWVGDDLGTDITSFAYATERLRSEADDQPIMVVPVAAFQVQANNTLVSAQSFGNGLGFLQLENKVAFDAQRHPIYNVPILSFVNHGRSGGGTHWSSIVAVPPGLSGKPYWVFVYQDSFDVALKPEQMQQIKDSMPSGTDCRFIEMPTPDPQQQHGWECGYLSLENGIKLEACLKDQQFRNNVLAIADRLNLDKYQKLRDLNDINKDETKFYHALYNVNQDDDESVYERLADILRKTEDVLMNAHENRMVRDVELLSMQHEVRDYINRFNLAFVSLGISLEITYDDRQNSSVIITLSDEVLGKLQDFFKILKEELIKLKVSEENFTFLSQKQLKIFLANKDQYENQKINLRAIFSKIDQYLNDKSTELAKDIDISSVQMDEFHSILRQLLPPSPQPQPQPQPSPPPQPLAPPPAPIAEDQKIKEFFDEIAAGRNIAELLFRFTPLEKTHLLQSSCYNTPLLHWTIHYALVRGNLENVRVLLANGSESYINNPDSHGFRSLQFVLRNYETDNYRDNKIKIFQALIEKGASIANFTPEDFRSLAALCGKVNKKTQGPQYPILEEYYVNLDGNENLLLRVVVESETGPYRVPQAEEISKFIITPSAPPPPQPQPQPQPAPPPNPSALVKNFGKIIKQYKNGTPYKDNGFIARVLNDKVRKGWNGTDEEDQLFIDLVFILNRDKPEGILHDTLNQLNQVISEIEQRKKLVDGSLPRALLSQSPPPPPTPPLQANLAKDLVEVIARKEPISTQEKFRPFVNTMVDNGSHAPIHTAVAVGNLDAVKTLIAWGANVNLQTRSGNTPFGILLETVDYSTITEEIFLELLKKGAKITDADLNKMKRRGYEVDKYGRGDNGQFVLKFKSPLVDSEGVFICVMNKDGVFVKNGDQSDIDPSKKIEIVDVGGGAGGSSSKSGSEIGSEVDETESTASIPESPVEDLFIKPAYKEITDDQLFYHPPEIAKSDNELVNWYRAIIAERRRKTFELKHQGGTCYLPISYGVLKEVDDNGNPVRGNPVRGNPVRGNPVRGNPVRAEKLSMRPVEEAKDLLHIMELREVGSLKKQQMVINNFKSSTKFWELPDKRKDPIKVSPICRYDEGYCYVVTEEYLDRSYSYEVQLDEAGYEAVVKEAVKEKDRLRGQGVKVSLDEAFVNDRIKKLYKQRSLGDGNSKVKIESSHPLEKDRMILHNSKTLNSGKIFYFIELPGYPVRYAKIELSGDDGKFFQEFVKRDWWGRRRNDIGNVITVGSLGLLGCLGYAISTNVEDEVDKRPIDCKKGQIIIHKVAYERDADGEYRELPERLTKTQKRYLKHSMTLAADLLDGEGERVLVETKFQGKHLEPKSVVSYPVVSPLAPQLSILHPVTSDTLH